MAFCRFLKSAISTITPLKMSITYKEPPALSINMLVQVRQFRKSYARILRVMKHRRKAAGPEKLRRRNELNNWNFKAELYAFNSRLYENISEDTLRTAFIHDSYIQAEEQRRKELDIPLQDVQLDLKSNASLIAKGHEITTNYLKEYLKHCFPKVPEEGLIALRSYLMSEDVMSHVSFNIGTNDLIFCAEYPPEKASLTSTLKAIIGSIATDDSSARAENFILDFICPQLIGKDVFEVWDLDNPLDVLNSNLQRNGLQECEPRLIFESGRNTIEAIYHVGLYSNKEFLGRGPGETLDNAIENAAYNVLRKLFAITESEKPICFGQRGRELELKTESHPAIAE